MTVPYHPIVRELAEEIAVVGGKPALPEERFPTWMHRVKRYSRIQKEKEELAAHMVSLASASKKRFGETAHKLVVQLSGLVFALVEDIGAVLRAFDNGGLDLRAATAFLGTSVPRLPVDTVKPEGSARLFDFMLARAG